MRLHEKCSAPHTASHIFVINSPEVTQKLQGWTVWWAVLLYSQCYLVLTDSNYGNKQDVCKQQRVGEDMQDVPHFTLCVKAVRGARHCSALPGLIWGVGSPLRSWIWSNLPGAETREDIGTEHYPAHVYQHSHGGIALEKKSKKIEKFL